MRKRLVTPLPVVGLIQIYVLSQQLPDLVAQQSYADMILKNGKVVSMDDQTITLNTPGNVYQAMAIKRVYRRVPSDQSARYCSGRFYERPPESAPWNTPRLLEGHWCGLAVGARPCAPTVAC